jgi:hypothetical protein
MRLIFDLLITAVMTALIALIFVEYVAGCGETYIDANGDEHQHECVFLPNKGESK